MKKINEIKILNSNKRVNKNFKSVSEAKRYIIDNNLIPSFDSKILIEESIKKYHEIKTIETNLSLENKQFFIDFLKKEKISFYMPNMDYIFNFTSMMYFKMKKTPWANDDLIDFYLTEIYERFGFDKNKVFKSFELVEKKFDNYKLPDYQTITDNNFLTEINKKYFDKIKSEFTVDDFTYTRTVTNYKPCNALCVTNKKYNFVLQVREDDIFLNVSNLYGRNVSLRKVKNMVDSDLKDFKILNEFLQLSKQ